jgi:CRISPR-associated protein Csb2
MRALGNAPLIDENGEVKAELRAVDWEREKGVFERYREPSRFWGSVTPVVLPGMDDRRSRKAIALVVKALAQAGCTSPVTEVSVQAEPVFAGAEMARRYVVPKYLEAFPRVHVIITFAETVLGPLAIGGGRHLGLGVCAGVE